MTNSITTKNIEFNPLKHHLGYIADFVKNNSRKTNDVSKEILSIGHSVLDIYTGNLSVNNILDSIVKIVREMNCFNIEQYKKWIVRNNDDYRIVKLNDQSCWTLRLGEKRERFIHIHPCRTGMFHSRFNASTLKTAILFLVEFEGRNTGGIKEKIDFVRTKYLNLPPVKSLETSNKIVEAIELIESRLEQ